MIYEPWTLKFLIEAYNKAKAISDVDGENSKRSSNASLVDEYNASKRSVSLLQKHRAKGKRPKKKSKQTEKEEWVGAHPWKPWDRENDLSAGRKKVDLDSKSMGQGLTSRFSSGPTQRNFLWASSLQICCWSLQLLSFDGRVVNALRSHKFLSSFSELICHVFLFLLALLKSLTLYFRRNRS